MEINYLLQLETWVELHDNGTKLHFRWTKRAIIGMICVQYKYAHIDVDTIQQVTRIE